MRIFRRRKKFDNSQAPPPPPVVDSEPLPDVVYQMGAEAAARYVRLRASSPNPHDPMLIAASGGIHVVSDEQYGRDQHFYNESNEPVFGFRRHKAGKQHANKPPKDNRFVRGGSPEHFHRRAGSPDFAQERAGSPYHFIQQERVGSPYHFAQHERVGSPYHFAQHERVGSPVHFGQNARPDSPEMMRRRQRAQHSQELQHAEKQQRRQQEMMMANAIQMAHPYPYGQQAYYPNVQSFPVLQAPQMYQYY